MAITDSTISVSVWDAMKTRLLAAAPIVTNSTTAATTAASIEAAYNDEQTTRPQIIIDPILIDEANWRYGSTEGEKFINVVMHCCYKNTLGAEQLYDIIRNAVVQDDIDGMELVALSTDYTFSEPGMQKYQEKTLTATYTRQ